MIYTADALQSFAQQLFQCAGLSSERAAVMARTFLEADLMGFNTHGLHRVASNLQWLEDGTSRREGEPDVLSDCGAIFSWDANFLPGPWVCHLALEQAIQRAKTHGLAACVIRRSQHMACLAAYLPRILEAELLGLITCSTPSENTVNAFGGIDPIFSANPIAMAIPSEDDPIFF